ncbi:hypothetical protein [Chitinimonas lacunae]|uniref:Uncharacterized protein n=1 Tax=Chitinimonas lacunae TaxID=1963018 RepID=A0ABV8MLI6_9NEIS
MLPDVDSRALVAFVLQNLEVLLNVLIVLLLLGKALALICHALVLQRAMDVLSPDNRPFPGLTIWISFIPLLGCLWYVVYILKLSAAIERELARRCRIADTGQTPTALVLIACLVLCLIPDLRLIVVPLAVVMWLVYSIKMLQYRRMLEAAGWVGGRSHGGETAACRMGARTVPNFILRR